jgi:hypothetical protein
LPDARGSEHLKSARATAELSPTPAARDTIARLRRRRSLDGRPIEKVVVGIADEREPFAAK